jgi:flagellar protein FliO/FliZ
MKKRFAPVLTLVPFAAHAQPSAPDGPSLLPMLAALVVVLALIPLAMWLLKRLGGGTSGMGTGLRVVTQLPLGMRERIVVVEAGERWLLLGVTATSITRIGTMAKGELPVTPGSPAFAALLGAARGRGGSR